jgi:hypothetical protein
MSQEPVTEQFPCEYCQQLCPPKQLHSHEVILTKMTISTTVNCFFLSDRKIV